MEIWKPVPGFGGHYEASSLGNIKARERVVVKRSRTGGLMRQTYKSRTLKPSTGEYNYQAVHIGFDGMKVNIGVHRLVALAWHGQPPEGFECCHNNGDASDNRPENLRWDTHANNNGDRVKHGTYPTGTDHPMSKFSADFLDTIRSGRVSFKDAKASHGISNVHFYRVRKQGL